MAGRKAHKSAISAVENPYLVVPHPKNVNHPMCEGCGEFAANTLVVPETLLKWPEYKGMFPLTHCTECAKKDFLATGTKYVFNAATCGCRAAHSLSERTICSACFKGGTEGCGGKRAGKSQCCNTFIAQNSRRTMTCFLCGADTTWDKSSLLVGRNKESRVFEHAKKGQYGVLCSMQRIQGRSPGRAVRIETL